MKITKKQLKQIIKEELMKEAGDPLATLEAIANELIKDGKEMEGWPSHIPASYAATWVTEQGEKIKKAVHDIDAEEGRNPGGTIGEESTNENDSYGNFNPSDGVFDDEQARLQSGAVLTRFEQDLDALIDGALDSGLSSRAIAEVLKMFAGSV